jgi:hypothetical protein
VKAELAKAPALQLVAETEAVAEVAETTEAQPGAARQLFRLATAPFVGLAYIMFLPVIGIAAAIYGIGMLVAKAFEPVVVADAPMMSVTYGEKRVDAVVDPKIADPGSLRDVGKLVVAPFKGLAYIVCLPLIILSAVAYGVGAKVLRVFRLVSIQ